MRIFRSDDTSPWLYKYGSGAAGNTTINSTVNWDSSFGANNFAFTGTFGQQTGTLASAYQGTAPVLIHQSAHSGYGNYELNYINNGSSSSTATLLFPLTYNYVGGAQLITANQFANITVTNSGTVATLAWNGSTGGIALVLCNGIMTVDGIFSALGAGFRGGSGGPSTNTTAFQGEGQFGTGAQVPASPTNYNFAGGGGGQFTGGPGAGGQALQTQTDLTNLFVFGGGGGGGNSNTGPGGSGGNGGGLLFIITKLLTVTGTLSAGGLNPTNGTSGQGAGGAGAGGCINLRVQIPTLGNNAISVLGGATPSSSADIGGCGGGRSQNGQGNSGQVAPSGRIHVDYLADLSGTTNPGADTRFDPVLQDNSPLMALF